MFLFDGLNNKVNLVLLQIYLLTLFKCPYNRKKFSFSYALQDRYKKCAP